MADEYIPQEYPKMLTEKVGEKIMAVRYPHSHEKAGELVIFADADEEKAYRDAGTQGIAVKDARELDSSHRMPQKGNA